MDTEDLKFIAAEVKRFQDKLDAAFARSMDNKGYVSTYGSNKGKIIDVGNISGTKESGALKRAALDLKRELTNRIK